MVVAIDRFWMFPATPAPAVRLAWFEALARPWSSSNSAGIRTRARAYLTASLLSVRANPVAAQDLAERALVLFKKIGDAPGVADSLRHLGAASIAAGDAERGQRELAESLLRADACGYALGAAWSRNLLGIAAFVNGDYAEASSYLRQCTVEFETGTPAMRCAIRRLILVCRFATRASCPPLWLPIGEP